jgi:hypothetical protein
MASNANTVPAIIYQSTDTGQLGIRSTDEDYLQDDPFLPYLSPNKYLPFPWSPTITESARTVNFAINTLGTTKHIYSSPFTVDVQNLATYFADWGFSYQIVEGPVYTISVDVAWDTISNQDFTIYENSDTQWEIIPVAGSKNLQYSGLLPDPFSPPTIAGNYLVLPLVLQTAVQRAVQSGGNYLNIASQLTTAQQTQYANFIPIANKILQYQKLGIDGVQQFTQQLKRSAVVDIWDQTGAFQLEADYFQKELNAQGTVNYLYSRSGLIEDYFIPDVVADFMMGSYKKQLGVPNLDPIIYNVYAGYLVSPPSISFIGMSKIQITQIFTWDEWAEGLYYIVSPSSDFPMVYTSAPS